SSVQIAADGGGAARSRQASCAESSASSQISDAGGLCAGQQAARPPGSKRPRKEGAPSITAEEGPSCSLDQGQGESLERYMRRRACWYRPAHSWRRPHDKQAAVRGVNYL